MMHGLLAMAMLALQGATPADTGQFTADPKDEVAARLALTPKLDGIVSDGEWDPYATFGDVPSFAQWDEVGLYVAAKAPVDKAIVVSVDGLANGWLVGADNLQISAEWNGSSPKVTVKQLDATITTGPEWKEAPLIQKSLKFAATAGEGVWTIEVLIPIAKPYGLDIRDGKRVGLRFDAVSVVDQAPFAPRNCRPIALVQDKGIDVPTGITWKPGFRTRLLRPGEPLNLAFEIANTAPEQLYVTKVQFSGFGPADRWMDTVGRSVDTESKVAKFRTDYITATKSDTPTGRHAVTVTCELSNGKKFTALCSMYIMPLITFEWGVPEIVTANANGDTIVKGWVRLRSNTTSVLRGTYNMGLPESWRLVDGENKGFGLFRPAEKFRIGVSIVIPAGVSGTFPMTGRAQFLTGELNDVRWIEIKPAAK